MLYWVSKKQKASLLKAIAMSRGKHVIALSTNTKSDDVGSRVHMGRQIANLEALHTKFTKPWYHRLNHWLARNI